MIVDILACFDDCTTCLSEDSEDFALAHNQHLVTFDFELGAGVFAIQHGVSVFQLRNFVLGTGTYGDDNARGGFGEPIDISNVSAIGCIYAVDTEGRTPVIHDVLGRRLSSLKKGINIVNGIKIVK